MMARVTFAVLLEGFFTERLMRQRQASAHTIASYRDTFKMLLLFLQKRLHKAPSALLLEEVNAPLIAAFLDDLEASRGNAARTRNSSAHGHPFVLSVRVVRGSDSCGPDRPSAGRPGQEVFQAPGAVLELVRSRCTAGRAGPAYLVRTSRPCVDSCRGRPACGSRS